VHGPVVVGRRPRARVDGGAEGLAPGAARGVGGFGGGGGAGGGFFGVGSAVAAAGGVVFVAAVAVAAAAVERLGEEVGDC
jgi:hypothetical protein